MEKKIFLFPPVLEKYIGPDATRWNLTAEVILVICWHSSIRSSVLLTEFSLFTWCGFKLIFVLREELQKSNMISSEAARMIKGGCIDWSVWWGTTTSSSKIRDLPTKSPEANCIVPRLWRCPGTLLYNNLFLTLLLMHSFGDGLKPKPELRALRQHFFYPNPQEVFPPSASRQT